MKDAAAVRAAALVAGAQVAALGTLHEGAPSVSMTPFALLTDPLAFVIHVSGLSAHTRDMLADARVGLLVMDAAPGEAPAHARGRIAVRGTARPVDADAPDYVRIRSCYLARFPDVAGLFELADFRLFVVEPVSVRVVLGFAQATSLTPATFAAACATLG